jgi:hypothetical protein
MMMMDLMDDHGLAFLGLHLWLTQLNLSLQRRLGIGEMVFVPL